MSLVEETVEVDEAKAEEVIRLLGLWHHHVVWTAKLASGKRRIVYRRFSRAVDAPSAGSADSSRAGDR